MDSSAFGIISKLAVPMRIPPAKPTKIDSSSVDGEKRVAMKPPSGEQSPAPITIAAMIQILSKLSRAQSLPQPHCTGQVATFA